MPTVSDLEGWGRRLAAVLDEIPDEGVTESSVLEALELAAGEYEGAIEGKFDGIVRVLQVIEDRESTARRDRARADGAIAYHRRQAQRVRGLARQLLTSYAAVTDRRSVVTTHATVSLAARTEYTYPDDIDEWPRAWVREETRARPDRELARKAIADGSAPDGFGRTEVIGLQVRGRSKKT